MADLTLDLAAANAHHRCVEPIAIAVNDLGEPDAGNPPVRFDEGRRLRAFYSTTTWPVAPDRGRVFIPSEGGILKQWISVAFPRRDSRCLPQVGRTAYDRGLARDVFASSL